MNNIFSKLFESRKIATKERVERLRVSAKWCRKTAAKAFDIGDVETVKKYLSYADKWDEEANRLERGSA